ncbi:MULTISPECIES: hypothetical protein [Paenibacillus]|uniref:hypothetical protein n=1 Tax=Paenibacillus TaxID=44249 RepID=UPI000B0CE50D|nr:MULTISPECIES: hypothetical protein [Paenibacillus]QDA28360.1 hypothetical protein FGY93_16215 [Paenibacillus polymyxa]RTZ37080.1 hypothetical protein EJ573_04005 [Paenibacillus polymyxa]WOZ37074.1 hypothetical protein RQP19_17095 [Paenibacillus polymyxa]
MKNSNLRKVIEDYFEGVPRKAEASDNNVFAHRRTSRLGPGTKVEEVITGTHPYRLTASRPLTTFT